MRSMNKYGVILIGGTIGSVFAGGNCSGKENEDEKNFKKLACECFKDIADSNFLHVMSFNFTDGAALQAEMMKKISEIKDVETILKISQATYTIGFCDGNKIFCGFMNLDKSKKIVPTEKVVRISKNPTKEELKKGFFTLSELNESKLNVIGQFIVKDDSKAPAAA